MEALEQLLELQTIDTEIAQLEHRAVHLPEAAALHDARRVASAIDAESGRVRDELDRLANVIGANESSVGDMRRQLERLNAQMKTIIAPREAEALQHEIAVVEAKISSLEDESLAALERSEECEVELARLGAEGSSARDAVNGAESAMEGALADVRTALSAARERRESFVGGIDAELVTRYDARRAAHGGIAVARLVRSTCGGCHIDLSTSEVEAVRRDDPSQRECPNCARWLVV